MTNLTEMNILNVFQARFSLPVPQSHLFALTTEHPNARLNNER